MTVQELTFKGEATPKLYACGDCGNVFSPKSHPALKPELAHESARRGAEKCCEPQHCECGKLLYGPWTACPECRQRNLLMRSVVVDRAKYDGPVHAVGKGEWGDGFSSDIAAMIQSCAEEDEPVPAYCHPCTSLKLQLNASDILEHAVDGMHEDAMNQVVDAEELFAFIKDWNAKQTCITYFEDDSRIIVLDGAKFQEIIEQPNATTEAKT